MILFLFARCFYFFLSESLTNFLLFLLFGCFFKIFFWSHQLRYIFMYFKLLVGVLTEWIFPFLFVNTRISCLLAGWSDFSLTNFKTHTVPCLITEPLFSASSSEGRCNCVTCRLNSRYFSQLCCSRTILVSFSMVLLH